MANLIVLSCSPRVLTVLLNTATQVALVVRIDHKLVDHPEMCGLTDWRPMIHERTNRGKLLAYLCWHTSVSTATTGQRDVLEDSTCWYR